MAFTHIQGVSVRHPTTFVTSQAVVLSAAPKVGNLVCIAVCITGSTWTGVPTSLTVQDSNGNNYTVTPKSPSPQTPDPVDGDCWLAYLLSAPSNASATITASWTNSGQVVVYAEEFHSDVPIVFDVDVSGSQSTGGSITTPIITPSIDNELLFAVTSCTGAMTSPTSPAGTAGVWTASDGTNNGTDSCGTRAEYVLSASVVNAVNFTTSVPTAKSTAMAMAFRRVPAANYRVGVFSKDGVLAVGAFDMGYPIQYGLFDDDFVAQFSGTVYTPNASQQASVPWGVFSKDATLDGAFDA